MLIKKFASAFFAVCLLLAAFSTPQFGAVDAESVEKGAVVEVYSGNTLQSSSAYGSPSEAWANAVSAANSSTETVVTLGDDWSGDELLTIPPNKRITLDLNGHYVKRNRNHVTMRHGEVFQINEKSVFTVRDSNPKSKGYDGVKGGVITGGASINTGGGVEIDDYAEFRMEGGTIYDCISNECGGAVYLDGSSADTKFTMTGGRIYGCRTFDSTDECYGGAIYMYRGTINISNAKIDDCYCEDDGGAIFSERGIINLNNVVFSGNKCQEYGGAIRTAHDTLKFVATVINAYNCVFAGNHADEYGGAVFINDNPTDNQAVLFHGCTFRNNSADKQGGAVYINDTNVALSSCEITDNSATGEGGGVFVDRRYSITLKGKMIIRDNKSGKGNDFANLVLDNGVLGTSRIINGGLYKGSDVHVGSTAGKGVLLSEWMSRYQTQYIKADGGHLTYADERKVESHMVVTSSIISEGGFYAVLILGIAGVIGTVILILYKKRKNKAAQGGEGND